MNLQTLEAPAPSVRGGSRRNYERSRRLLRFDLATIPDDHRGLPLRIICRIFEIKSSDLGGRGTYQGILRLLLGLYAIISHLGPA